ncbi:MAG: hypothetical protein N4A62_09960 [Marinisporobacter sp.]|jgi:hypothetical protein|nr:hypothetical protein [Marinisporobacter sp.]
MQNNEKFEFLVNESKKTFTILLKGFWSPETVDALIKNYHVETKKIKVSNYSIIVDANGLKTSKMDMTPLMGKCMQMYFDTGFNQVFLVEPESPTSAIQMKSALKAFPKLKYLKSVNSIL